MQRVCVCVFVYFKRSLVNLIPSYDEIREKGNNGNHVKSCAVSIAKNVTHMNTWSHTWTLDHTHQPVITHMNTWFTKAMNVAHLNTWSHTWTLDLQKRWTSHTWTLDHTHEHLITHTDTWISCSETYTENVHYTRKLLVEDVLASH